MSRPAGQLVGRDFGGPALAPPAARRLVPVVLLGALLAGLGLAALRVDLIRVRYALATARQEEQVLLEERRELIARVRSLRDPVRLKELARAQGFVRPTRVIDLRDGQVGARP